MDTNGGMMEIEFVCHHCGKVMEEGGRLYPKRGAVYLVPCSDCLDSADNRGYGRGYDEGQSAGYDDGFAAGVSSITDDIKAMLTAVRDADCAVSKAGEIPAPASSS
jgi:hypothetical protein